MATTTGSSLLMLESVLKIILELPMLSRRCVLGPTRTEILVFILSQLEALKVKVSGDRPDPRIVVRSSAIIT